jgi:hypothetical protein
MQLTFVGQTGCTATPLPYPRDHSQVQSTESEMVSEREQLRRAMASEAERLLALAERQRAHIIRLQARLPASSGSESAGELAMHCLELVVAVVNGCSEACSQQLVY